MEEEKGFVIKDRRAFAGQDKESEAKPSKDSEPEKTRPEDPPPKDQQEARSRASDEELEHHVLPEVNFATFVVSLSSSVLVALGEIEDPATGQRTFNQQMAKHTIDILGLLEEKTRGNLTVDEENLLKNMLYDLRMRYVRARV